MNPKLKITITGYLAGMLAYWFIPYNTYTMFGINMFLLMCAGSFLGAFILYAVLKKNPSSVALLITLGAMLAIISRIFYDISLWDKTSHNLFPFELVLYTVIIMPSAFAGAYLAHLIFSRKRN